ncbi:unnamed protein product, partial [Ixodes persulcatus]
MRLATHAICWYGYCSYGYRFTGKYVLFRCSLCHQTLQHIIRTTDGGACLVLKTFQGDLGSYHTCEPGCFHYLAKFDVGAAKASCPFHVNSGQHWKKQS